MSSLPIIIIAGPLPPPYIGPSIATQILLSSSLSKNFRLFHFDLNTHTTLESINQFSFSRSFKTLFLYTQFAFLVLRLKPDLILLPISETTLGFVKDSFFIAISRVTKKKTLLQLRGGNFKNWIDSTNIFIKKYVIFILKGAEGIIVLGNNLKYMFEDYYKNSDIHVIPNGADYPINSNVRKSNKKIHLLYLSNFIPSKGLIDVITSLKYIEKKILNKIVLDAVGTWGDSKLKKQCMLTISQYSLPVFFHNEVYGEKKFSFFKKADIFLFPPCAQEGHPWVIVEALAFSLPIVATDRGAISESVIHGENGYIIKSKRPDLLAESIIRLIENDQLRTEMGLRSRAIYLENFTASKMVHRYSNCFKQVLNSH
jgi:glycosyltransferase involved in cell wall biosynthesis